ncbi:pseudouridine synthase [Myriangium duriaei CBS 260.36]|uniref:Pseudouridine synthase n=1 Tax=Myriangium duriaei CBS 260.36 TaxID=1168546 RepID=A0A9P4J918_9PEZI|nr:pseudouridine synthase [Myriangium duriaei CBS 260.36]
MALTVVEQKPEGILSESHLDKSEREKAAESTLDGPPAVAITPCDPWPRPYYLHEGLRRVAPYHFTYNTWCKERWRGRPILEIFADEFRDRPVEYYEDAIRTGGVQLNGKKVPSLDHIVKNGDLISHTLHRHEPPVSAEKVGIVSETNDMLVINKPAGIPVHPAGRYNYNSIVEILRSERGHGFNPLPCNRLDRLTSGIMFIAKHRDAAERMTEQLTARTVRKEYVARVRGEFPEEEVTCDQPVLQISPKLGLNRVRANGKTAKTVFQRIAYHPPSPNDQREPDIDPATGRRRDGYSIVFARPLTGRTHQIRVHLQYLSHPIANDPIYANQRVFGPDLGAYSSSPTSDETILSALSKMGKSEVASAVAWHDEMVDDYNRKKAEKLSGEVCDVCGTELYTDPGPQELGIWLHARRYESADGAWGYETGLPKWALPPEEQAEAGKEEIVVTDAKVMGDLEKALEETKIGGKGLVDETAK